MSKRKILLVEPAYHNKYPPLGLMKISTYHKLMGDIVTFVKGCEKQHARQSWDRIYVSTLFTFYWDVTVKTIEYYKQSVETPSRVFVGGVTASLMGDELAELTGCKIVKGLLNEKGVLDHESNLIIDNLIPDYSILSETHYKYSLKDSYIGYATRGCPNSCSFCAVNQLETHFQHYLPLKKQIQGIESLFGGKKDMILLDNNVLASNKFETIANEIMDLGFHRGAKFQNKKRRLDFNQGLDARLLDANKIKMLSKTAIEPMRLAFDDLKDKDLYVARIRMAKDFGLTELSNYILYNYNDTPWDFYDRLRINVMLNSQIGTHIYSFPMKYVPLNARDRSFVGKHWNKKLLRGIQCILLVTKGLVSTKEGFFYAAFGYTFDEFRKIALMPTEYIIHRQKHRTNGAADWASLYDQLSPREILDLEVLLSTKKIVIADVENLSSSNFRKILEHYVESSRLT